MSGDVPTCCQLVVDCRNDAPDQMVVDVMRFRQILLNLISNAIKFTESGCVTIVIPDDLREGREWVVVDVEDTGPGIPEDAMEASFEPFIQGEMSTSRLHGGTGLGLAISNRLAKALGGKIWAKSTPGKGSCFTLTLPTSISGNRRHSALSPTERPFFSSSSTGRPGPAG